MQIVSTPTGSVAARNRCFVAVSPLALAAALITASAMPSIAHAQDVAAETAEESGPEIVITGSRRTMRSAADAVAPVDLISAAELRQQPSPDVSNNLRVVVPSLNVNDNGISGTSAGIRPVTLRGLSPDHTLVLINGKRMGRSADVPTFSGGISDGSQSPDVSILPSIALKQVQVLRDGAAAQYGADAIAGVINFIMDDSSTGGTIQAQYGSTYAGDGDSYQIAGTYGTKLGSSGFLRGSFEYSSNDRAVRAVQRSDAAALQAAGWPEIKDPATRFGTPEIRDNIKALVNLGTDTGFGGELYAFGGYNQRKTSVDFFYRNPTDRDAVFTNGGYFLVGDMTPDDGVSCPGTGDDRIAVGSADALQRLTAIAATPNCFTAFSVHPGGYTPYFINRVSSLYGTMGLRGELLDKLTYDFSVGANRYQMKISVHNSLNPSLGSLSPTDFENNGQRIQSELVANADFSYPLEIGFAKPLNIAFGSQFHRERFEVVAGQPESYEAGVLATQGFQIGEDAYAGYSPEIAGAWARNNVSLYLDLETNPIEQLDLGAALRYEHYSDFGSEVTYKLSGMFHFTRDIAVRSTYATGFHAPSPGQQNYTGLGQELTSTGALVQAGVIPSTNPIALAVGGQALKPEKSKSFSAGFVFDKSWFSLTVDYFRINMRDRLTQSATYSLTNAQRDALVAAGYAFASQIGTFRFFTNDFSSRTEGVDVVATVPLHVLSSGRTTFSLNANYTKNTVTSYDPTDPGELLSEARVIQLERNLPRYRGNATLSHDSGNLHGFARLNYYGKYTELHVNSLGLRIDAGSEITADAEVGYRLDNGVDISVGAQDVFNNYPDLNPYRTILGSKYPTTAPMGVAGGTYYLRVGFNF